MRKETDASPRISDAEWVLMRVLWSRGKATANEVVAELDDQQDWKPKTIHTLLRRLADKGALGYEKSGREFVFFPTIDRDQAEQAHSKTFISSVLAGRAVPFLARFLEAENLSDDEIAELQAILDRRSK